jgi:hypothetical protein
VKPPYVSTPRKQIELLLKSLINEVVNVRFETVDYTTTVMSIAVGNSALKEGALGVAVALRNEELAKIAAAINRMLHPGDPGRACHNPAAILLQPPPIWSVSHVKATCL